MAGMGRVLVGLGNSWGRSNAPWDGPAGLWDAGDRMGGTRPGLRRPARPLVAKAGSAEVPMGPFPCHALASPGATRDIGSALTRMCMRHRSIETKLRQFTK